jgi:hypothetical protein
LRTPDILRSRLRRCRGLTRLLAASCYGVLFSIVLLCGGAWAVEVPPAQLGARPLAPTLAPPASAQHFLSPGQVFLPWSEQPERWFVATAFDAGFLYVRPRFEFGYGRPHWSWAGIEVNPIFTDEGLAAYAGARWALPFLQLRVGGRYWYAFRRSYLIPAESYTVEDLERLTGPRSTYLTWEAELSSSLPLGPGSVLAEVAGSAVTGVDDGYYVYEETLRVVVDPPWVWRARAGYAWALALDGSLQLGPIVEVIGVPNRGTVVLRAGGIVRLTLAADLEVRGTFVPAIATPDPLSMRGGDAFLLGIRYRWATGP